MYDFLCTQVALFGTNRTGTESGSREEKTPREAAATYLQEGCKSQKRSTSLPWKLQFNKKTNTHNQSYSWYSWHRLYAWLELLTHSHAQQNATNESNESEAEAGSSCKKRSEIHNILLRSDWTKPTASLSGLELLFHCKTYVAYYFSIRNTAVQ